MKRPSRSRTVFGSLRFTTAALAGGMACILASCRLYGFQRTWTFRGEVTVRMEAPSKLERRLVGALVKTAFLRDRRRAPPPAPAIAREVTFEGNTGARIAARWFAA